MVCVKYEDEVEVEVEGDGGSRRYILEELNYSYW